MGRHIRWQAILTVTGIALTLTFLSFLAFSRETITVPDTAAVYREGIAGSPQFINPLLAQYNLVDQDLTALIFNGLTRADGKGGLEPDLAQRWEVSDDGLAYLFELRPGIRWQDNERFTADDVIFTINLMRDPEFPGVPYLHELWSTVTPQKLDDNTVRFILSEPFPAFLDFTTIGILPEHRLKNVSAAELLQHPFNFAPIGTGPYKLEELSAQFARFSINPHYAGPKPRIPTLELWFYPSHQETIAAYQAGEIEGISQIPAQFIPTVQEIESLNFYTARLSGYTVIYLNLQTPEITPFFTEATVRQALLHGIDRQAIINQALNGQAVVAAGPIHAWSWAYNPDQVPLGYDLAKANGLLDAAGWIDNDGDGIREKEGQAFTFTLLSNSDPDKIQVANLVRDQWAQMGVSAQVEVIGLGLGERLARHDFEAAIADILLTGDPDPYPLWHQAQIERGQNYGGWSHEQASNLLETAQTITNTGRRNDYYYEFQEIFAQEVPALILFHPTYTYAIDQDIFNVQLGPMTQASDRFRTIAEWYTLTQRVIYSESQFQDAVDPGLEIP